MSKESLIKGRVSFGAHEEYRVLLEHGGEMAAVPSGALRAYEELPAVGDWVMVREAFDICLIEEVEARKTAFVRKAAGRVHASQCVAAKDLLLGWRSAIAMTLRPSPAYLWRAFPTCAEFHPTCAHPNPGE